MFWFIITVNSLPFHCIGYETAAKSGYTEEMKCWFRQFITHNVSSSFPRIFIPEVTPCHNFYFTTKSAFTMMNIAINILHALYGAVWYQLTHFYSDDRRNICTPSCHHQTATRYLFDNFRKKTQRIVQLNCKHTSIIIMKLWPISLKISAG